MNGIKLSCFNENTNGPSHSISIFSRTEKFPLYLFSSLLLGIYYALFQIDDVFSQFLSCFTLWEPKDFLRQPA
jgi:hypothetical protein